jgi:capsular polysaccharide transport system permease protein
MFDERTRISEIELQPIRSKGELVVDDWWEIGETEPEPFWRRHWLALVTIGLPVALAIVYLAFIASNQYVSEARFIVRTSALGDSANIASFMQDQKITRATDETIAVSEYMTSRDALAELEENDQLREILARKGADPFNRFPNFYTRNNREGLYRHFLNFVDVHVESDSGIATLKVRAFTPEDAQRVARAMLADAEKFVNRLNTRVYRDTLALANRAVDEERQKFADVEERLTAYRNEQKVIDPNREAAAALGRLGTLMASLSQAESALSREVAETPRSPQIASMSASVQSLRDEIAKLRDQISGSGASLAGKFSEFDKLVLDRELASRGLEAAMGQWVKARENLEQQQYYLQTVVQPNAPDQETYPRRVLDVLLVFGISFCVYWIAGALLTNIKEHQT